MPWWATWLHTGVSLCFSFHAAAQYCVGTQSETRLKVSFLFIRGPDTPPAPLSGMCPFPLLEVGVVPGHVVVVYHSQPLFGGRRCYCWCLPVPSRFIKAISNSKNSWCGPSTHTYTNTQQPSQGVNCLQLQITCLRLPLPAPRTRKKGQIQQFISKNVSSSLVSAWNPREADSRAGNHMKVATSWVPLFFWVMSDEVLRCVNYIPQSC